MDAKELAQTIVSMIEEIDEIERTTMERNILDLCRRRLA